MEALLDRLAYCVVDKALTLWALAGSVEERIQRKRLTGTEHTR